MRKGIIARAEQNGANSTSVSFCLSAKIRADLGADNNKVLKAPYITILPIFVVHDHAEPYLPNVNPSSSSMKIRSKLRASKGRKYHSNVNEEKEGGRERERRKKKPISECGDGYLVTALRPLTYI